MAGQPGNTLSDSRHFVTRGGKTQDFPPPKGFFAQPQLDALSQSLHTGCETSLVLTGIPQKKFDAQFKMFICVTFFSKSNHIELSSHERNSAPQMKFIASDRYPKRRLLWVQK